MALQKRVVDVPFALGLDQKSDVRWLQQGAQTSVVNGRYVKQNAIQKRFGFNALTKAVQGGGTLATTKKLCAYKGEIVSIDGDFLYSYSPTATKHLQQDRVSECVATRLTITPSTNAGMVNPSMAELLGYRVFVWQTNVSSVGGQNYGKIYADVIDTATGLYVIQTAIINGGNSTSTSPRVVFTQNTNTGAAEANVLWYDSSVPGLMRATWVPGNTAFGAPVTFQANTGTSLFDICPYVGDPAGSWFTVFEFSSGTNRLLLRQNFAGSATQFSGVVLDTQTGITAFALRATFADGIGWVAYAFGSPSAVSWAPFTPSAFFGATPANWAPAYQQINALAIERASSTSVWLIVGTVSNVLIPESLAWQKVNQTMVVGSPSGQFWYQYPVSKPFTSNGRVYCLVQLTQSQGGGGGLNPVKGAPQQTQVVMDLMTDQTSVQPRPVATVAPRASGQFRCHSAGHISSITNEGVTTATAYNMAGCVLLGSGFVARQALVQITVDFNHPGRWLNFEIGDALFISGGVPAYYDGQTVAEAGYFYSLDSFWMVATLTAGTGLTHGQTYSYVWVLEWVDGRGAVHREQASQVFQITTSSVGNDQVTWTLPTLGPTWRYEPETGNANYVYLIPYRTAFISGSMSSTLFRALATDAAPTTLANIQEPTTLPTQPAYIDAVTDASIATNPIWLGQPGIGVVEPQCPSSFVAAWLYRDRVMAIGDDQETVWFSNKNVPGEVPRFNDVFTFTVPGMGPLIAGGQLDASCILFSRTSIAYFTGDGPNDENQQNDFSTVTKVQTDVGCIEPRSVVSTPMGLMFQSSRGIYLLSRSVEVSYIGKSIEDTLVLFPVITSAVLVTAQNEVRFTCTTVSGTTGITLRYNYLFDAWSTDNIFDSDQGTQGQAYVTAAYANGTYYCATRFGQIYQENTTLYTDAGTFVSLSVESAWIKAGGIQNWGRFWRMYAMTETLEVADLVMQLGYDYSASYVDKMTWTAPQIARFATPMAQVQMMPSRQKCEAIRLKLSDATPTGGGVATGQGMNFVGITAEMGVYPGGYRLPAAQKG